MLFFYSANNAIHQMHNKTRQNTNKFPKRITIHRYYKTAFTRPYNTQRLPTKQQASKAWLNKPVNLYKITLFLRRDNVKKQ